MSIASITPGNIGRLREDRRSKVDTESGMATVAVASDLVADLIISAAHVAAFDVAEAQCEEADIDHALRRALGTPLARILRGENGLVWAGLYFRTFLVALHRREFTTALQIISVEALMAFLSSELEGHGIPAGSSRQLRESLFGEARVSTPAKRGVS